MSSVLVTGGAGYVGSHAAKALRAAGHRTIVFDNLSAGHRAACLGAPLVVGSIGDVAAVRAAIRQYNVTAVMHFAAWLQVGDSVRDPVGYYRNNVIGTLSLLDAVVAEGITSVVFSSTCAVYGEPRETPLVETHQTQPVNAYGQTKLAIEHAFPHYERAYGLRAIALRYFNAAGADPDGELGEDHFPEIHVIPRAFEAATGGAPLQIFGDDYPTPDGTCLRDYVHVTDLADAHVRALQRLESGGASGTFNLGTEKPASVLDIIAAVERVSGRKVAHQRAPRRPGDPAALYALAAQARSGLGWTALRTDLDTIVADAWRWHSTHPSGYGDRTP